VTPASGTVAQPVRATRTTATCVLEPTSRIGRAHDGERRRLRRLGRATGSSPLGFVDPKRIGMAGHSYGGYEVNALVTHTNIFRRWSPARSDSDLPSLYGGFWAVG